MKKPEHIWNPTTTIIVKRKQEYCKYSFVTMSSVISEGMRLYRRNNPIVPHANGLIKRIHNFMSLINSLSLLTNNTQKC